MRRELLLLREMRDAATTIRGLGGRDLPQMIAGLDGAIAELQEAERLDPDS